MNRLLEPAAAMHWDFSTDSRVFIELRAAGLLRAVAHDPTLSAWGEPFSLPFDEGSVDTSFVARFPVDGIDPPTDLRPSDREKLRDTMRGEGVLDAARFPIIEFHGRFLGTLASGTLAGDLVLRGVRRPIAMPVVIARERRRLTARGTWEGPLTGIGIKPFRAMLGAVKLDDWVRLRLEAKFDLSA